LDFKSNMKKILIILALFAFIPAVSWAEWSKKDTVYQLTYSVLHVVDWGQTRYGAKNSDKFHENNFFLGRYPSVGKVDTYFSLTLIGHAGVSYLLPAKADIFGLRIYPRRTWQVVWIGVEAGAVARNFSIGVKIGF